MNDTFLYDTYALMEILNRNPNYEIYLEKNPVINEFIFAEFCYNLIKCKVKDPRRHIDEVKPAILRASPEVIEEAMEFRYKNKKKKLSMADCVSYCMARKIGIKFLTGDKEFRDIEGVEFVK